MSASYQQTVLIGNVGNKDAELRYTPSGKPVASFSMAINKDWTKDGEKQSKSIWYRVSCWDRLAEIVGKHVKAGMQVMAIGEIEEARTYTDKDGNARASLELTARVVKFLSGRGDNSQAESESNVPF